MTFRLDGRGSSPVNVFKRKADWQSKTTDFHNQLDVQRKLAYLPATVAVVLRGRNDVFGVDERNNMPT